MTDPITAQLTQASEGLLFPSESDAPFEAIHWKAEGKLTPATLLQLTGHSPNSPVAMMSVDKFFAPAVAEQDWHDDEEKETVRKFQNLVTVLKANLSKLQVFMVSDRTIDVYIIGTTPDGDWAGLVTKVIET